MSIRTGRTAQERQQEAAGQGRDTEAWWWELGRGRDTAAHRNAIQQSIDDARSEVDTVKPWSEWTGNLASYGRHIQPAKDALDTALEKVRNRPEELPLDEWQDLAGKYNRLRTKFDKITGKGSDSHESERQVRREDAAKRLVSETQTMLSRLERGEDNPLGELSRVLRRAMDAGLTNDEIRRIMGGGKL